MLGIQMAPLVRAILPKDKEAKPRPVILLPYAPQFPCSSASCITLSQICSCSCDCLVSVPWLLFLCLFETRPLPSVRYARMGGRFPFVSLTLDVMSCISRARFLFVDCI
ncbi:hypothetical protein LZ32DRAFT_212686 [Colletotrichum eremochloae]|nr:hypothetical protein LZ32DRAFT_212686 [Colletotrichum eremochloae]